MLTKTTFADPKADFVFKRIFGSEPHKHLLVALLNALLERDEKHLIRDVTYLTPEQSPPLPGMKHSVVDVKCRDEQGRYYVAEMQVLGVEAFEKRMVYNTSKACTMQLPDGEAYSSLAPLVGVTICNFMLWPLNGHGPGAVALPTVGGPTSALSTADLPVPMLSHWHMQEQKSGVRGFSDIQYRFLELPKYAAGPEPVTTIDCWAYLFRNAHKLAEIPPFLQCFPFRDVLEIARVSNFTQEEWEVYDKAKMAEQDARGVASLARKEGEAKGREEGEAKGLAKGLRCAALDLCQIIGVEWSDKRKAQVEAMSLSELEALREHLRTHRRWP